ncbi:DUF4352 domain-containing protein [Nocardia sp. NPDC048505]|uniref:DUF4352 domain-containing protein n=1 Tax=unclassified Nocardia TaxID=2637762 RepID=UPI0034078461
MTTPPADHTPQNPNWSGQPPQGPGVPYAGQPGHPGHALPPRKSNGGKIALIVIAGIIGLCGFGGLIAAVSGGSEDEKQAGSSATAAAAPEADAPAEPEAALPGLNTPVRDGKFEFVVTRIETGLGEIGDNPYLQRKAQGSYTVVTMTIKNTSGKPQGFSPSSQYLFDTQNRKFESDVAAAINLQADTSLYASVNPGNSITAQVVFDLPAEATPSHLVLHDSMFSGGAKVTVR